MTRSTLTMQLISAVVATLLAGVVSASTAYENGVKLEAAELFPAVALSGDHYRVGDEVTTDGYLTRTNITSDYGEFIAIGPGMVQIRIHEIGALAKLETFEASDEFKRGAKESAEEKWSALKTLADTPQETLEGLGEGVSRFFKRTARSAKTGMQKADDLLHDRVPGAGAGAGPGAKLPGGAVDQPNVEVQKKSKYEQAAIASGEVAINILGFADARRKLAKRLQVDPYTSNKVLSDKLDEITWSIFAGNLGVDLATSLIPGGAIISSSAMVTDLVWDTPPGDLRVKVEKTLLAVGISQEDIDRLLRHRFYTLTMQASIASNLEKMNDTEGKAGIMDLVLSVASVDQARFVAGTLQMLRRYHEQIKAIEALTVAGTVVGRTADAATVIAAPVDYLSLSESFAHFAGRQEFRGGKVDFHIAGQATAAVRQKLKDQGWQLTAASTLFGR